MRLARLAVARLSFCSNSFAPRRPRGGDVVLHDWYAGISALHAAIGTGNEIEGVGRFIARNPDWQVDILRSASFDSGGPLDGRLFTAWLSEVEASLSRLRYDALYIALHGACQAEGDPIADLTVLRRVRSVMGPRPVVASFDTRANLSEEVALLLDGATASRPGIAGSAAEAAERALDLTARILSNEIRPVGALVRLPSVAVGTSLDATVDSTIQIARAHLQPPLIEAALFTGYAWCDSPFTGPSALVWADRAPAAAREAAARLAVQIDRPCRPVQQSLTSVDHALRNIAATGDGLPALLLDVADDPQEGAMLDTPEALRDVQRTRAFGHLPHRLLFAALLDADGVAEAARLAVGANLSALLGGKASPIYGEPVPWVCQVIRLGWTPATQNFAVLRSGGVDVLIISHRPPALTPELLAECGFDLTAFDVLLVKGGARTAGAFALHSSLCLALDCVGPTMPDLLRLPYNFVPASRRATVDWDSTKLQDAGLLTRTHGMVERRSNVRL